MMKTIKQIADEIGVSKQAVFYRIKKPPLSDSLQPFITIDEGVVKVSLDGETFIKQAFRFDRKEPASHVKEPLTETLIDMLKLELEAKNRQIEAKDVHISEQQSIIKDLTSIISTKDNQILELTQSLNAAQALHAGTIQKQLTDSQPVKGEELQVDEKRRRWWEFWRVKAAQG